MLIENRQQAVDLLKDILENRYNLDEEIEIGGSLQNLEILIEGPTFHGELTGELARAIGVYQDAIYALAKTAIYGDGNHPYSRLSPEQKAQFELQIAVEDGSLKLTADFKPIMKGVAKAIRKMNPKTVAALIILLGVLATAGVLIYHLGGTALENADRANQREHHVEVLKHSLDANGQLALEAIELSKLVVAQEGNANHTAYVKSLGVAMTEAHTIGVTEIARAAPTASSIEFGSTKLDEEDIKNLNRRAPRAVSEPFEAIGDFRVKAETTDGPVTKVTFFGKGLPNEITTDFIESEFDQDKADAMWNAIRQRTPISVKIQALVIRESLKGGVLVDINPD